MNHLTLPSTSPISHPHECTLWLYNLMQHISLTHCVDVDVELAPLSIWSLCLTIFFFVLARASELWRSEPSVVSKWSFIIFVGAAGATMLYTVSPLSLISRWIIFKSLNFLWENSPNNGFASTTRCFGNILSDRPHISILHQRLLQFECIFGLCTGFECQCLFFIERTTVE